MPRVLIPSDNPDFIRYLSQAYARAGWDAVVGADDFDLPTAHYDRLHLQWPEELSSWQPPTERRLGEIIARLESWRSAGAELLLTVHNLRPHRQGDHRMYQRLFEAVYERIGTVLHFTNASRDVVIREFPSSAQARHLVTGFFNLNHLVPEHRDMTTTRRAHGFREEEFVVLVFGGLRDWAEVELIRTAFDGARLLGKRLLVSSRYHESGPAWRQRFRRWKWKRWLHRRRAVFNGDYIPDEAVHTLVDAANAVIIPRRTALNSGVVALGASFGKIIIAPNCGAYPELLAGTQNPIFTPGDARSLARKIEEAAQLDRMAVAEENAALAQKWSWENLIGPNPRNPRSGLVKS